MFQTITTTSSVANEIEPRLKDNLDLITKKYPSFTSIIESLGDNSKEIEELSKFIEYETSKTHTPDLLEDELKLSFTDDVDRITRVMNKAFKEDHSNDYIMKKLYNIPVTEPCSKYRIEATMHMLNAHYFDSGAEIIQANNFHAVAIWTTPENPVDLWKTNDETFNRVYLDELHEIRDQIIPKNVGQYYLFTITRDPDDNVTKGSVRSIFEYYKERADRENAALTLEAINENAKKVYEYFGFKSYKTFHYGVGEVNSNGEPAEKGEGFTGYLMIYHKNADMIFNRI
ncbi:hypothetical protein MOUN0_K10066 [Monosporozyma unispora]|nr:hypothetical protein C6P44_002109 [Kazachstania unispora]